MRYIHEHAGIDGVFGELGVPTNYRARTHVRHTAGHTADHLGTRASESSSADPALPNIGDLERTSLAIALRASARRPCFPNSFAIQKVASLLNGFASRFIECKRGNPLSSHANGDTHHGVEKTE